MSKASKAYLEKRVEQALTEAAANDQKRREAERANNPAWQALRADPEYQKAARKLEALKLSKAPAEFVRQLNTNPKAVAIMKRVHEMERDYGIDKRADWERADTRERFVEWLDRVAAVQLLFASSGNPPRDDVLQSIQGKALELAARLGISAPLTPPAAPTSEIDAEAYRLALRDWASADDPKGEAAPTETTPADDRIFPPMQFHEPKSTKTYSFTSPRLWQVWKTLWNARQRLSLDELQELPCWAGKAIEPASVQRAISDLRKYWKQQQRQDLAKRIKCVGQVYYLETPDTHP